MSDPFDVLREPGGASPAPDVGVIKARARRIERRRRVVLSSAAGVIAVVAVVGVLSKTGPGRSSQEVAQRASPATESAQRSGAASTAAQAPAAAQLDAKRLQTTSGATKAAPAAPPSGSAQPTTAMAGAAPSGDGSASMQTTIDVAKGSQPHSVSLTLSACNTSGAEVHRSFPTGELYDFEVSQNSNRVWRWSDGRAFAQHVSDVSWAPHECKRWSETWNGTDSSGKPVATGSYQAVGVLTSSPALRTATKTFCLDLC